MKTEEFNPDVWLSEFLSALGEIKPSKGCEFNLPLGWEEAHILCKALEGRKAALLDRATVKTHCKACTEEKTVYQCRGRCTDKGRPALTDSKAVPELARLDLLLARLRAKMGAVIAMQDEAGKF